MTEFDSNAFSAVDSFFVVDKTGSSASNSAPTTNSTQIETAKTRRLGVGAKASTSAPKPLSSVSTDRLLQVGSRKRNRRQGDDEDDDDLPADDDDEEEVGRTGIVSEDKTPAFKQENVQPTTKKKKKKKKAGKKERQKLKEQEAENQKAEKLEDQQGKPGDEANTTGKEIEQTTTDEPQTTENNDSNNNPNKAKKKRRKVRSKQKNIYKDNRSWDQKPDHLLPGGFEYKGRPMTHATKKKLMAKNKGKIGLPPSVPHDDGFRQVWDDQQHHDNGVPMLSSNTPTSTTDELREQRKELPLPISGNKASNNKSKKKKKLKYKNIQ